MQSLAWRLTRMISDEDRALVEIVSSDCWPLCLSGCARHLVKTDAILISSSCWLQWNCKQSPPLLSWNLEETSSLSGLTASSVAPNDMGRCRWTEERERALIAFYSGKIPPPISRLTRTVVSDGDVLPVQNTAVCGTRGLRTTTTAGLDSACWRLWAASCPSTPRPSQVKIRRNQAASFFFFNASSTLHLKRSDMCRRSKYRAHVSKGVCDASVVLLQSTT